MENSINAWFTAVNASIEAMSIFQKIGGSIFLLMTVVFFSWIFYLTLTK